MKFFNLVSCILLLSHISLAQEIRKVFDGTQAYCPEVQNSKYLEQDIVITTSIQGNQLLVQATTCVDGKLQKVSHLKKREYQTLDGVNVIENYDDFNLVMQSVDLKITKKVQLPDFQEKASSRIDLKELQEVDSRRVDVHLMSERLTETNNGYRASDDVSWGSTRLFFK